MVQAVSRQPPNHVGPGSISVQSMRDLWWRGDRFFFGYFGFRLSLSFHQCLIHIHADLFQDRRPKSGNVSESSGLSEFEEHWMEK